MKVCASEVLILNCLCVDIHTIFITEYHTGSFYCFHEARYDCLPVEGHPVWVDINSLSTNTRILTWDKNSYHLL